MPQKFKQFFRMNDVIKITKGLTINLKGTAEKIFIKSEQADFFAVKPTDFHGLIPKLEVQAEDTVLAGSAIFHDKNHPDIKFTSPISGTISAINRGERRQIMEVIIKADGSVKYKDFLKANPALLDRESVKNNILQSGLWPVIIQRPYDIIANPGKTPKAIFISAFDTAPLAPDYDFLIKGLEQEFQYGIDALAKLTDGKIHLNIESDYPASSPYYKIQGVQINKFLGKHPAGNVGVQINHIDPVNKGETVWCLRPQNVVAIGRLFLNGQYDASRIIVVAGPMVKYPRYYKTIEGTSLMPLVDGNIKEGEPRIISGNILTGKKVMATGYLGYYDSMVTIISEGNYSEFLGWALPGFRKFSLSHAFFSWLTPSKTYSLDTNLHGGHRTFVMTGQYEKVFPMDILPVQLIKAILANDIDKMEQLGIYEVAPEDFALCEFVCTSKIDAQEIVRNGLDAMMKEMN
jgi:Na+-transporting NADH:ubiquinone oxidoreductase subunit A